MVCPKQHSYKLKRWTLGEQIQFYFATQVQIGVSIEACPMFKKFNEAPINMAPWKTEQKVVNAPMN
jgi:hypothetical protein